MPIFIGGMFKSGTSLTRKFLGNHPKVYAGLETNWFRLDKYFFNKDNDISDLIYYWHTFYDIEKSIIKKIIELSSCSEEVLDKIMFHIISKSNNEEWCDKSPPNIAYSKRIFNFWDNPKIIHVIRNPFDIFCSHKEANHKLSAPKEFVEKWCKIFDNVKKLKGNKNYIEEHYEDLILDTNKTLKNIYKFCNLDWQESYKKHNPNKWEYQIVKETTGNDSSSLKRLSEKVTSSRIGIHKSILTQNEKDQILKLVELRSLENEFNEVLKYF